MAKPLKIAEIKISIYEDGRCVVNNTLIHDLNDLGKIKELVPKKELVSHLLRMTPNVRVDDVISKIDDNSLIGVIDF